MDNYLKEGEADVPCAAPFPDELLADIKEMLVKENTKFKNIHVFVSKLFEDEKCRRVIFKGVGEATAKCISCVEVFKRNYKKGILYQWNKVVFTRRTDFWTPTRENLNKILVHVDVPTIFILLSRDPFPDSYISESCQSTSEDVTGFSPGDASTVSSCNISPVEKPKLCRPAEPNRWNRPPRKIGKTHRQHSSTLAPIKA